MIQLHDSVTSSHLALRATPNIPATKATAPSSALASSSGMRARTLQDKDMDNTDSSGMVVDNDTRTPLITSNQCMLNSDTNSHNPSLIYTRITTHPCVYPNLT